MNVPTKSLGKFTPHVDPGVKAKLASWQQQRTEPKPAKAGVPVTNNGIAFTGLTSPAIDKTNLRPPKFRHSEISETRQPGSPVTTVRAELYVEIIDDPQKLCPAFAYVACTEPPGIQRIVAVLNCSLWPTAAALAKNDFNALRWLIAGAIQDRCLTWPSHPILYATGRYLAHLGLGDTRQGYQLGLWAAYKLKDHPMFRAIDGLSILKAKSDSEGRAVIEKFASFDVQVDSVRLADWRAKFRNVRKREQSPDK